MLNMMLGAENQKVANNQTFAIDAMDIESEKEQESENIKEKEGDEDEFEMANNILTRQIIKSLNNNKKVKKVILYCEYGFNLDYDSAMRYTTFNALILAKKSPQIRLNILKPQIQDKAENKCYIKNDEKSDE